MFSTSVHYTFSGTSAFSYVSAAAVDVSFIATTVDVECSIATTATITALVTAIAFAAFVVCFVAVTAAAADILVAVVTRVLLISISVDDSFIPAAVIALAFAMVGGEMLARCGQTTLI